MLIPSNKVLFFSCLLFLSLSLIGCGSGMPDEADETVELLVDELNDENSVILWQALPESYQSDVNSLVQNFASKMDEEIYEKLFLILEQAVHVLEDKKELILASSFVSNSFFINNKDIIDKRWDEIVDMAEILVNSQLSDLSELEDFDGEGFLLESGNSLLEQWFEISDTLDEKTVKSINTIDEIQLISASQDKARVKIIYDNSLEDDISLIRIEERWLPIDLVTHWKKKITEMTDSIDSMSEKQRADSKLRLMPVLVNIEMLMTNLEQANNQQEFDQAIQSLIMMSMTIALIKPNN